MSAHSSRKMWFSTRVFLYIFAFGLVHGEGKFLVQYTSSHSHPSAQPTVENKGQTKAATISNTDNKN